MPNLMLMIPSLCFVVRLFGEAKAGGPYPMPETSTPSTTPPTTAAPVATIQRSNQEPDIIIGLSVSVFGLISFLVAVGVVTKICNDKKRPRQYQDARNDTSRF